MTDGLSEAYDMKKWDVFCENNDLLLENDQLNAENAELRKRIEVLELHELGCGICKDEAVRQNAELRELCADLYDHAAFSIDYFGDAHGILPRMRELGIEVDA